MKSARGYSRPRPVTLHACRRMRAMPPSSLPVRESIKTPPPIAPNAFDHSLTVNTLTDEHADEVLEFLAARPLHSVVMVGFIRDHGLVSQLNRGTFYACRDSAGALAGGALIR